MRKYNKQDVIVTEQVFDLLVEYDPHFPDMSGVMNVKDTAGDSVEACGKCGGVEFKDGAKDWGTGVTTRGKYKVRRICLNCKASYAGKKWFTPNRA